MSRETRRFIFLKNTCTSSRQIQEDYSFHRKGDRPGLVSAVWHHSLVQACIVRSLVSTFSRRDPAVAGQERGPYISPPLGVAHKPVVSYLQWPATPGSGQLAPATSSDLSRQETRREQVQ